MPCQNQHSLNSHAPCVLRVLRVSCVQRRDIPIDQQQIDAIILAEDDAASDVLQAIYGFISSDAYRRVVLAGREPPPSSEA